MDNQNKVVNRFIVMCVEQYALFTKRNSGEVYSILLTMGIIDELLNDYEDLHGMSTMYLNDYIASLESFDMNAAGNVILEHILAKTILITKVIELIADKYKVTIDQARSMLYSSEMIDLIDDDETGLYGESPLYVFSLFEDQYKK